MLCARVIPCLDVHAGRVVKGVNFIDLVDAGDPVEQARLYDAAGADDDDVLDSDTDLLEDALMEAGLDADLDDDSGRQGVEDGNA